MREEARVTTLRKRRVRLTDIFANKFLKSDRFKKWFPENDARLAGRQSQKIGSVFPRMTVSKTHLYSTCVEDWMEKLAVSMGREIERIERTLT